MNAMTEMQQARMTVTNRAADFQNAIQRAVLKENIKQTTLKTKPTQLVNLRRCIFDTMKDLDEAVFPYEMKDHLQMFGYSPQAVETEIREMYKAGMLVRTKLRPYAYTLKKGVAQPSDEFVKIRTYNKAKPIVPVVVDPTVALPSMAKLNGHIENLTAAAKIHAIQYGYLGADIDLVTNHFSKLRNDCLKTSSVDPDVATEYDLVGENIDQMIEHMKRLEKSILQIANLAKTIRSNPL